MNNDTLFLNLGLEKDVLKIDLRKSGDSIWPCEEKTVSLKRMEDRFKDLAEIMDRAGKPDSIAEPLEEIKQVGRLMANELFPLKIKEKIGNTDARNLILTLDDRLVHIPWELACIDSEFLCLQFNMGRMVKTAGRVAENKRKTGLPYKMWIIANPSGDLANAGLEGKMIYRAIAKNGKNLIKPVLESEIKPDHLFEKLQTFDMVHFAGHAEYDSDHPEKSYWKLHEGRFSAESIMNLAGGAPMPYLVFSNACRSAQTRAWTPRLNAADPSFGLANAFKRSGVAHYIGANWKISDEFARLFAEHFYESLLSGMSVGESIRLSRIALMEKGNMACLANYLLYGDPGTVYFKPDETAISLQKESVSYRSEPVTIGEQVQRSEPGKDHPERRRTGKPFLNKWLVCLLIMAITGSLVLFFKTRKPVDEWTLKSLTLSVAVKEPPEDFENYIAHTLESRIQDELPWITLLERISLDLLLKEYDLIESKLIPRRNKIEVAFLAADLYLIIEINRSETKPIVLMRLADERTSQVVRVFDEPVDQERLIRDQKEALSKNVLSVLRSRYPLRGRIIEVSGNRAVINIGYNQGVRQGRKFRIAGSGRVVRVETEQDVKPETCVATIIGDDCIMKKGEKVEGVQTP